MRVWEWIRRVGWLGYSLVVKHWGPSVRVGLDSRGQAGLMKGQSTPRWVVVNVCLSVYKWETNEAGCPWRLRVSAEELV